MVWPLSWRLLAILYIGLAPKLSSTTTPSPAVSIPVQDLPPLQLFPGTAACSSLRRYASSNGLGTQPTLLTQLAAYAARYLSVGNAWRVNSERMAAAVPDTMSLLCGCTPAAEAACGGDDRLLAALDATDERVKELNGMLVTAVETRNGDLRAYNERRQRELNDDEKRLQVKPPLFNFQMCECHLIYIPYCCRRSTLHRQ